MVMKRPLAYTSGSLARTSGFLRRARAIKDLENSGFITQYPDDTRNAMALNALLCHCVTDWALTC